MTQEEYNAIIDEVSGVVIDYANNSSNATDILYVVAAIRRLRKPVRRREISIRCIECRRLAEQRPVINARTGRRVGDELSNTTIDRAVDDALSKLD